MANNGDILTVELAHETIIHDLNRAVAIMRIQGVVVLPIGAEIELTDPNISVRVERMRLLAGTRRIPTTVCLDVRVPEEWWDGKASPKL